MAAVVALTLWTSSLVTEYLTLPRVALSAVRKSINLVLSPARKENIEDQLRMHIHARLEAEYPPGGILGYMRWAATSGKMDLPRVIDNARITFLLSQRRWWWIVRVVLSLIFTAGAFLSQILPLSLSKAARPDPPAADPA